MLLVSAEDKLESAIQPSDNALQVYVTHCSGVESLHVDSIELSSEPCM